MTQKLFNAINTVCELYNVEDKKYFSVTCGDIVLERIKDRFITTYTRYSKEALSDKRKFILVNDFILLSQNKITQENFVDKHYFIFKR